MKKIIFISILTATIAVFIFYFNKTNTVSLCRMQIPSDYLAQYEQNPDKVINLTRTKFEACMTQLEKRKDTAESKGQDAKTQKEYSDYQKNYHTMQSAMIATATYAGILKESQKTDELKTVFKTAFENLEPYSSVNSYEDITGNLKYLEEQLSK